MRRGIDHTHFASRRSILHAHGRRFDPRKTPESDDSCESAQTDPKRGAQPRRDPLGTFYLQLTTPTEKTISREMVVGIDLSKLYSGIGSKPLRRPSGWDTWCYRFRGSKKGMKTRTHLRRVRRYRTHPSARALSASHRAICRIQSSPAGPILWTVGGPYARCSLLIRRGISPA